MLSASASLTPPAHWRELWRSLHHQACTNEQPVPGLTVGTPDSCTKLLQCLTSDSAYISRCLASILQYRTGV